jgi:hypothetical protein
MTDIWWEMACIECHACARLTVLSDRKWTVVASWGSTSGSMDVRCRGVSKVAEAVRELILGRGPKEVYCCGPQAGAGN